MLHPASPHRALIAVLAALAAGCGGANAPEAPKPVIVRSSGAGQRVDASMTVGKLTDPASNALQRPPAGERFVQLEVQWSNRAGKLPIEWARFSVLDAAGRAHPEAYRLPERRLYQGRDDTPRYVAVGFALPEGAKPATMTMTSAVASLPLRGRWALG